MPRPFLAVLSNCEPVYVHRTIKCIILVSLTYSILYTNNCDFFFSITLLEVLEILIKFFCRWLMTLGVGTEDYLLLVGGGGGGCGIVPYPPPPPTIDNPLRLCPCS